MNKEPQPTPKDWIEKTVKKMFEIEKKGDPDGHLAAWGTIRFATKEEQEQYLKKEAAENERIKQQHYLLNDAEELISQIHHEIIFIENKFKPALLGGNIVFQLFDNNTMDGINRGFLVVDDTLEIYGYNGMFYEYADPFIKDIIQRVLKERCYERHKKETLSWIKDCKTLHINRNEFDTDPYIITLENCQYNIQTGEIQPHSPENLPSTYFPTYYDPDATCPQWTEFLQQSMYQEDIPVFQEMVGFCFIKPYLHKKAFMLVGPRDTGKSTALCVVNEILGKHNISAIPLQQLCKGNFTTVDIVGKFANICSDLDEREVKNIAAFKALTGGDLIRAEKKYAPNGIHFYNTAKLVFSCNTIPECKKLDDAYLNRWIVFEYPNQVPEPEQDHFLKDKLIKEGSGIFLWAMDGAKRLLKNGVFSGHRTMLDVQEYMAENKHPVKQFCDACVESDVTGAISKRDMYKHFLDFCKFNELKTVSIDTFGKQLQRFGPITLDTGQSRVLGGKTWKGIGIKPFNEVENGPDQLKITHEKIDLTGGDDDDAD